MLRASVDATQPAHGSSGLMRRLRTWLGGGCALCRGPATATLCAHCIATYAGATRRCPRCALRCSGQDLQCGTCRPDALPYRSAIAAVDYAFPWDRLIGEFKFAQRVDWADALAAPLIAALRADGAPARCDAVTAVPLAANRLRQRGYNQAWELARRVAGEFKLPSRADALCKLRDTEPQMALDRAARLVALRGAYMVEPHAAAWVAGRRIALVDDVMTTGATLAEASSALLRAGAQSVDVWVVARTEAPAP